MNEKQRNYNIPLVFFDVKTFMVMFAPSLLVSGDFRTYFGMLLLAELQLALIHEANKT